MVRTLCPRLGRSGLLAACLLAACGHGSGEGGGEQETGGSLNAQASGGNSTTGGTASETTATGGAAEAGQSSGGASSGSDAGQGSGSGPSPDFDAAGGSEPGASGGTNSGGAQPGVGGADGSGGNGQSMGDLLLSGLQIELNPLMPLGCYVRWTTDQPAASEVRFGVGGYAFHVVDEEMVTEHEVYVVGMRADTQYDIQAVSQNEAAAGSATGTITTGSLPSALPARAEVITAATDQMQPGYTLVNFWDSGQAPTLIVALDAEGYPVWFFQSGTANDQYGATSAELSHDGTIIIGNSSAEPAREVDLEGNILWEGPAPGGEHKISHDTTKTKAGTYFVLRESDTTARIEELDAANNVLWSWDLYEDSSITNNGVADWCHLNAVLVDASEEHAFLNCRFQGLFKIEKATKNLVWQLGAAADDDQTGDVTYLPDNSVRFNDAHDPEVHEDGTVLFYDNQGWANRQVGDQNGNFHSQVVEYQVDDASKEATLVFQFPGSFEVDAWYTDTWSTPVWGDADRLQNRNILVTAGVATTQMGGMNQGGPRSRIFEVTNEGEVVWAIEWPEGMASYRADRIELPVQPL